MEYFGNKDEDLTTLTSFNLIVEGDDEGLISKIFSKFKTAVSGPSGANSNQQLHHQRVSSPTSSMLSLSMAVSNESGVVATTAASSSIASEKVATSSLLQQQRTSSTAEQAPLSTPLATTDVALVTTTDETVATSMMTPRTTSSDNVKSAPNRDRGLQENKTRAASAVTTAAKSSAEETSQSLESNNKTTTTLTLSATPATSTHNATAVSNETQEEQKLQQSKISFSQGITSNTYQSNNVGSIKEKPLPANSRKQQHPKNSIPAAHTATVNTPANTISLMVPLRKTTSIDSDNQSIMTTFSVSNTNSLNRLLNRLRGGRKSFDNTNKEFWMPDEQCKECNDCRLPFNLFRRRHHCRTCGRIFCSKCLSNSIQTNQPLRVCNDCYIKFVEGYRAEDTISLHDGYSYSTVVVDASLSSSLQQAKQHQQHQQKPLLIPGSGDNESSEDEIEEFVERPRISLDLQRPATLDGQMIHSNAMIGVESDLGIKKLLTNSFLRTNTPRSRTSTMNSLGVDTSLATLEGTRQQQLNSPMPFRRSSFIPSNGNPISSPSMVHHEPHHSGSSMQGILYGAAMASGGGRMQQHQQQNEIYENSEDDDLRRWDKNPRNLLSFLGGGTHNSSNNNERPNSGLFSNLFFDDFNNSISNHNNDNTELSPNAVTSTMTALSMSTNSLHNTSKRSSWVLRPERSTSFILKRRLSWTENGASSSSYTMNNNSSLNTVTFSSNTSPIVPTVRHMRMRTRSLMRNTPFTAVNMTADQSDDSSNGGGYESTGSNSGKSGLTAVAIGNRNSFHQQYQQLPATINALHNNNISSPEYTSFGQQSKSQHASIPSSNQNHHPFNKVITHQKWDPSFTSLLRNIVSHLLTEGGLPHAEWGDVILRLLLNVIDEVQPQLRIRDTFNMNHYIKVKKIPGGQPNDCFSLSGIVLSKSVAHKDMVRKIKNPSILILNFDLDGFATSSGSSLPTADGLPRQEYLKFDRLLAWERDHMNALISEIISLRPHIVLVAANVPRTIIDSLNKAKIVIAYNIKKQKLDAIARCTDATVFNYKNELWNAKTMLPTKCGSFETMTVMHEYLPNRRKTFLMFHECPKDRGATIILRGGDLKTLSIVKFIMNFMITVVNNINLEAQLRATFIELRQWYQPDEYCARQEVQTEYDQSDPNLPENNSIDNDQSLTIQREQPLGIQSVSEAAYDRAASETAIQIETQSVSALSVAESQITVSTADISTAKHSRVLNKRQHSTIIVEDDDICLTAVNNVLKKYQSTTMSISPGVSLPVPHILLKLRESQQKLIGLIRERLGHELTNQSLAGTTALTASTQQTDSADDEKQSANKIQIPPIPTDLMEMPSYFKSFDAYLEHDLEYRHYQDLHLRCWLLYKKYIGGMHEYMSPIYHQQIIVRRTTTPMDDHTIPCQKAVLEPFEFYNPLCDCTLGQYILNAVKEAYTICSSKMCGGPLIFHDRTYAHGNAQVKVQVFYLEDENAEDNFVEEKIDISRDEYLRKIPIFISTHCNKCNRSHSWHPMSDMLQRYSFGKFLELLFYQTEPIPLSDNTYSGNKQQDGEKQHENAEKGCPHGFYRDHTISFRIQNLSVNFTHSMVKVLEVYPPPLHLRFSSKQQRALKDAVLESTRAKISRFFDSIIERNKAISYDIVHPNMIDLCKEYVQDLSQEAMKNKKQLLQKVQMEYATSAATDTLQINNVLVDLQNYVVTWDLKYVDFARRFVRPERELKRLTTNHLRKMFPAETLYNNRNNLPAVSNLDLRTKRAIEALDLPLLDVTMDTEQESAMSFDVMKSRLLAQEAYLPDAVTDLSEKPMLGESPTESYPWHDELKRFDQMFLQEGEEKSQERNCKNSTILSKGLSDTNPTEQSVALKESSDSQKLTSTEATDDNESTRDLDPSVARRLSLELMIDKSIVKKRGQKLPEEEKENKQPTSEKNAYEADKLAQNVPSKEVSTSQTAFYTMEDVQKKDTDVVTDKNKSVIVKRTSALPIFSHPAYKKFSGILPEADFIKSRSSPAPRKLGNVEVQYKTDTNKTLAPNKTSQFGFQRSQLQPYNNSTQLTVQPVTHPPPLKSYRGSPYATIQQNNRPPIAYRYGFMGGFTGNMHFNRERGLGMVGITHPLSAFAAANSSSNNLETTATFTDNTQEVKQIPTISRPRSRTMAIIDGSNSSTSPFYASSSTSTNTSNCRIGGRIPVLNTQLSDRTATLLNKTNNSSNETKRSKYSSQLPVPTAMHHQHRFSNAALNNSAQTLRQRLYGKGQFRASSKRKMMMIDHFDDENDDKSSSSSLSYSSDEDDEAVMLMQQETLCQQDSLTDLVSDEEDQNLLPFKHNTFSLFYTDEYDESLGRDVVPTIDELKEFHKEHQLQMTTNTLPFLSIESGVTLLEKGGKTDELRTSKADDAILDTTVKLQNSNTVLDLSTQSTGRNSIMRAITYVLAEKSITNFAPLEYPL
ncbi:hypothetical protein BDF20DRAFT_979803 [Mycotypha africana]|uniref:uncharacterized protein n=1 Tax=Mycotypha africana TaxID=64632 RepID=UPI002300EBD4|nr:uncharacterized protein BDF20DRAFT_979803 [Mycotypha africana]KAI8970115.1 hypothetical protein BDF20DRAFT_979803 [Mycotypha africana]